MKKSVVFMSALSIVAMCSGAYAANPDTGPGCGLGKLVWDNYKNQKNIMPQVLMATTNGTGMNTFAISSGTSGCTNDGQIWSEQKTTMFAEANFEHLAQDLAQGQGENLTSLAVLMGVPADRHDAFFAVAQDKYTSLVQTGDASPVTLVKALNEAIAGM